MAQAEEKNILVLGAGSAGKRHAQNLAGLGYGSYFVDPREDRLEEVSGASHFIDADPSIETFLGNAHKFNGVIVASPPAFHIEQALKCLDLGADILMEKPLSTTEPECRTLIEAVQNNSTNILLGYTWRWWPAIRQIKAHLENAAIGDVRYGQFYMSAHLADWHPWERYQDFFMSSHDLGGGALLDESHWIDLMLWFFGMPKSVFANIRHVSSLEIDTDDNVDMLVKFEDGLEVHIHLDLFGRPHEKYIRLVGEEGTIYWSENPNSVQLHTSQDGHDFVDTFSEERNYMFAEVAKEFVDVIEHGVEPTCRIDDGLNVLRVIEAARRSAASKKLELV